MSDADNELVRKLAVLPNHLLLPFLLANASRFECDNNYWNVLGTCWKAAGSHKEREKWLLLFRAKRRNQHKIMKTRERRAWRQLPKTITVYRAATDDSELQTAMSWSTDKAFVERYAKTESRIVLIRTINKSEAWAYFDRRQESETLIIPTASL